jgi:hypothetical protein
MRVPRSFVVICLVAVLAVAVLAPACAEPGARAAAMGGAFVGLADDTSATYWNPAALPWLDKAGVTYMHGFKDSSDVGLSDFLAYVQPWDESSSFGLSYARLMLLSLTTYDAHADWKQNWYWLSYGIKVAENTSIGANLRWMTNSTHAIVDGVGVPSTASSERAYDFAIYHRASEALSLGVLVQNLNDPKGGLDIEGERVVDVEWPRLYRVGAAYREPKRNLIGTVELYDATDEIDRSFRFGLERKVPERQLAFRAGWNGTASGITFGAGTWREGWSVDLAYQGGDADSTWCASATAAW